MIVLSSPGEIAFKVFNLPIYYYGIIVSVAAIVGFYCSLFIAKKYYKELNSEILYDIVPLVIVGGFLCARLYYCLLNIEYYSNNLLEIFDFRQGGLSIHGGIVGGLVFGCLFAYTKKYPMLKLADIIAYGLVLAQAVGRWGNFFNNEAYGLPTDSFIAVFVPLQSRVSGYESFNYFHPTFLYESFCNLIIFLILLFVIRRLCKNLDGFIFASYLILYSLARFFIEGIRIDCIKDIGVLHVPQIASIIMFILGVMFISIILVKNKKTKFN